MVKLLRLKNFIMMNFLMLNFHLSTNFMDNHINTNNINVTQDNIQDNNLIENNYHINWQVIKTINNTLYDYKYIRTIMIAHMIGFSYIPWILTFIVWSFLQDNKNMSVNITHMFVPYTFIFSFLASWIIIFFYNGIIFNNTPFDWAKYYGVLITSVLYCIVNILMFLDGSSDKDILPLKNNFIHNIGQLIILSWVLLLIILSMDKLNKKIIQNTEEQLNYNYQWYLIKPVIVTFIYYTFLKVIINKLKNIKIFFLKDYSPEIRMFINDIVFNALIYILLIITQIITWKSEKKFILSFIILSSIINSVLYFIATQIHISGKKIENDYKKHKFFDLIDIISVIRVMIIYICLLLKFSIFKRFKLLIGFSDDNDNNKTSFFDFIPKPIIFD